MDLPAGRGRHLHQPAGAGRPDPPADGPLPGVPRHREGVAGAAQRARAAGPRMVSGRGPLDVDGDCHRFARIPTYESLGRFRPVRGKPRRADGGIASPWPDRPSPRKMFRPVSSKPDLVGQEHEILDALAGAPDLRPAARPERRQGALELPGRADHGQQPDGRPPRLGPGLQGPVPALLGHAGPGPALPERLRLPGAVGRGQRRAGPRLHEQARHRGIRHRGVRQPVQAARPDVRGPPDRAVDPPGHVDGLERPGRAAAASRPAGRGSGQPVTTIGSDGKRVTDTAEQVVGRLHMPELGGSYFTFSNEPKPR